MPFTTSSSSNICYYEKMKPYNHRLCFFNISYENEFVFYPFISCFTKKKIVHIMTSPFIFLCFVFFMIFFLLSFTRFSVERIENAGCQSSKKWKSTRASVPSFNCTNFFFGSYFVRANTDVFFYEKRKKYNNWTNARTKIDTRIWV